MGGDSKMLQGGILARNLESDEKDLVEQGIDKIDFVICNLYPFRETVAKPSVTLPEAVEDIDIGTFQQNQLQKLTAKGTI